MADQLPAEVESREVIAKAVSQLARMVRHYATDRNRIRKLATFAERFQKDGKIHKYKARVECNDRPEVELYLSHRDDFEAISAKIAEREKSISVLEADPAIIAACLQSVARLEDIKWRHLTSMEKILAKLSDECGSREAAMVKLATDAAKMAQADQHHRDRMELEDGKQEQPDAKIDRLAKKFNMTREEVCEKLNIPALKIVNDDTAADG